LVKEVKEYLLSNVSKFDSDSILDAFVLVKSFKSEPLFLWLRLIFFFKRTSDANLFGIL